MDRIRRYVECYVPITTCNLQCHYCYITVQDKWKDKEQPIGHSPEEIAKALSRKRFGGTCLINLCGGGETLLCPQIVEVLRAILEEGHYVSLVTNGTVTKKIQEIAQFPEELLHRLMFKFSYHYLEQHRLGITERFFENIRMMHNAGASFTLEVTPNDELVPHIEDLKKECQEYLGANCHVTITRNDDLPEIPILTKYSDEEFYKIWEGFDSPLFEFKRTIFGKRLDTFCYAGEWSVYVHLGTGNMSQCYEGKYLDNIYEHMDKPLHFEAIGCNCTTAHCYNGHSFLSLGDMPDLDSPSYAELRDRVDTEGKHWLQEEMRNFLSGKLCETNKEYPSFRKWRINRKKER